MKELDDIGITQEQENEFLEELNSKLKELGVGEDQISQFLETEVPKLRSQGHWIDQYIKNTHRAADYKDLNALAKNLFESIPILESLGWETCDELSQAIGGTVPHRVSCSGEVLSDVLRRLKSRVDELRQSHPRHYWGRSATDEAKDRFAGKFVKTICDALPEFAVTTITPEKTTFVVVVRDLFSHYTGGVSINAKKYVSRLRKDDAD